MSVFDLFRGFFGVPGGIYRGRRDPFFDAMTHEDDDDDDDDEDDVEEAGVGYDGFRGHHQDPFDSTWRFGFSFGADGMKIHEPPMFGHVLREMEEMFSQLGHRDRESESGHFGVPRILPPPHQDGAEKDVRGSSGNLLRDFMLKSPDAYRQRPPGEPRNEARPSSESPEFPGSPFHGWAPLSKFHDIWRPEPQAAPEERRKEDRDLDSAVSSGGLDQILAPPAGRTPAEPGTRPFFQSVTVTKVVKPDGTVEERRTIRDGQGNEETTVTRSGGADTWEGPDRQPAAGRPAAPQPPSDLQDIDSFFSKFFGGFK